LDSTLADWFSESSQDSNSPTSADPLFDDAANGLFYLKNGSPAINTGTDLGASYDDALLPGSSWPSSVQIDDQDDYEGAWEIGAYIFQPGTIRGVTAK
jgi:hypothetical protein